MEKQKREEYPFLILSCPRSATMYTARYLRHHGFLVGHEHLTSHGTVAWQAVVQADEAPWLGSPRRFESAQFTTTISIHRHPLRVISSLIANTLKTGDRHRFLEYVSRYVPLPLDESDIDISLWFWVGWNKLIFARNPTAWFRVEDEMEEFRQFCATIVHPGKSLQKAPELDANHRKEYQPLSFDDIADVQPHWIVDEFVSMSEQLGYDLRA